MAGAVLNGIGCQHADLESDLCKRCNSAVHTYHFQQHYQLLKREWGAIRLDMQACMIMLHCWLEHPYGIHVASLTRHMLTTLLAMQLLGM